MKTLSLLLPIGLALATPAAASPAAPAGQAEAQIAFADHGGVEDWRSVGDSTVYFRDQHNRWYRADLLGTAFDLPFVEQIGIDARPNGTLDKFGAILVRGQRYPFTSFVAVDGPPSPKPPAKN